MSGLLRVTSDGAVLRISLDRPEVRNALSVELLSKLDAAFVNAALDPAVRVVVLSGEGTDFCAGADLGDMKKLGAASPEENRDDARRLAGVFRRIHDFPRPVVARVQGNVFGGGCGLVAACDLAVIARGARFAFSEVRLGILPAVIGPFVLAKIGSANARALFLTGERFGAERACAMGLGSHLVEPDELDDAIEKTTSLLLQGSPDAQRRIKLLLDAIGGDSIEAANEKTPDFIAEARASEEGQEGLRAFFEKRKPSWIFREESKS